MCPSCLITFYIEGGSVWHLSVQVGIEILGWLCWLRLLAIHIFVVGQPICFGDFGRSIIIFYILVRFNGFPDFLASIPTVHQHQTGIVADRKCASNFIGGIPVL